MRIFTGEKRNIFVYIAYIVLIFFLMIAGVYAWFTATARQSYNSSFATLKINICSGSDSVTDSDFTTTYLDNISPGSTVNFNSLSVANIGDVSVYTIVKLKLKFEINGIDHCLVYYYNLDGQIIDHTNIEKNLTPASLIESKQTKSLNLSFTFEGSEFTNDFKQKRVEFTFTALAIQSLIPEDETGTYPTSELYAVYYLVKEVDTDTDIVSHKICFYDDTGKILLYLEYVNHNASSTYTGVPTKQSTGMYNYTFTGWVNAEGDFADLTNITSNTTVYASFDLSLREYELSIDNSTSANLTVQRDGKILQNGSVLYYGDVLTISYDTSLGATGQLNVSGATKETDTNNYVVIGNVVVTYTEENISYKLSIVNTTGAQITVLKNDNLIYDGGTIYYGDILKITFKSNAGYTGAISVSGAIDQGDTYLVRGDVVITYSEIRTPYSLQVINTTGADLKITRENEIITSSSIIYYDDILNISFIANVGRNGQISVSGAVRTGGEFTYSVKGNVIVTYTESLKNFFLEDVPNGVTVNKGEDIISTGMIIYYGDTLTITYYLPENYELIEFDVVGANLLSGNDYFVVGDVNITFTIKELAKLLPFVIVDGEIIEYTGTESNVEIPSTYSLLSDGTAIEGTNFNVTKIGNNSFINNSNISSVTIPNSIQEIGNNAFQNCKNLANINWGEGITNIGERAFSNCTSLQNISLPINLKTIGRSAFQNCVNLVEITLDSANLSDFGIYNYIFTGIATSTNSVTFNVGENATRIPSYIFDAVPVTTINWLGESNCEIIAERAFVGCPNITSLTIPASIQIIEPYAFTNCRGLQEVTFEDKTGWLVSPNNDVSVGKILPISDFNDQNKIINYLILESGNVSGAIGYSNYYWINTDENVLPFVIENGVIIEYLGSDNVAIIPSTYSIFENGEAIVGSDYSVVGIGDASEGTIGIFSDTDLTTITIPNSITAIGEYAFNNCATLDKIYFTGNINDWVNINFGNETANPMQNGADLYINDQLVTSVDINTSTEVKDYAFTGSSIDNLIIGAQVDSVGNNAFANCENLNSVTIENGVKNMGNYAFYNCTNLNSITIPSSLETLGWCAFEGCSNLEEVHFEANSLLTYIDSYTFKNTNIHNLTLPEGLLSIGQHVFEGCSNLTSVDLPNSLISLDNYAFYYCPGLTSISIPANLTSMGFCVFEGCSNLESVTFEEQSQLTSLSEYAFANCTSLVDIVIPDSIQIIKSQVFDNCTNLKSIVLGGGLQHIANYAFRECSSLTSATFANPYGWFVATTSDATNGIDLSPTDIQNTSTAATYLKATYLTSYWTREDVPLDFEITNGEITKYTGTATEVVIPSTYSLSEDGTVLSGTDYTITGIADGDYSGGVFYGKNITSVTLPNTIKKIGSYAFYDCTNLTSITIPDSVTSIGGWAFMNCNTLITITIGEGLQTLSDNAFSGCKNVIEINFNAKNMEDVNREYNGIFQQVGQDSSGITLNIGPEVTRIPAYLFYPFDAETLAPKIIIVKFAEGSKCREIGEETFSHCGSLTSITIPASVTSIESYAFGNCSALTEVAIESNYAYRTATSTSACGLLLSRATEVRVLISCIGVSTNSYLENTENFTKTTSEDGLYYIYTKI